MEWKDVRTNVANYFGAADLVRGITANDILNLISKSSLDSFNSKLAYVGPIDWTWGTVDELGQKLKSVKGLYLYRCNQVDGLLHEAGFLIDRSLSDLLRYDELNLERFKVLVEFVEFDKTQAQQAAEQKDQDFWNGPSNEADLAAQGRTALTENSDLILKTYDGVIQQYKAIEDDASGKPDWTVDAHNSTAADLATRIAKLQYSAQKEANALDADSRVARKRYETRARLHQIARQEIAREIVAMKIDELHKPGGALNYNDRMREMGKRALGDFLEAYARLNAIAIGLKEFYSVVDPSEADIDVELNGARTMIEGAVNWLRRAANAIGRARMDEQECVLRLSLEPSGKSALLEELRQGRSIEIKADMLTNMQRVQLRGVSATAEGVVGDSWVDVELKSPTQQLPTLTLPSVQMRLGRVSSSASLSSRDIGGGRPIINRSPLGTWTVHALRDGSATQMKRLHLDFHLVFLAV
jgi:hypothetical protein